MDVDEYWDGTPYAPSEPVETTGDLPAVPPPAEVQPRPVLDVLEAPT